MLPDYLAFLGGAFFTILVIWKLAKEYKIDSQIGMNSCSEFRTDITITKLSNPFRVEV